MGISSPAWGQSRKAKRQAAKHYDAGQKHYNGGRFAEAIGAFSAAHRLAPHHSALFNIARCYENQEDRAKAVDYYQQALKLNPPPDKQADIEFRIRKLRSRPVKVFISSFPAGATVTVDGNAAASKPTPVVLLLSPGEHMLLLRKESHYLAARRIVVQMDKELPVQVKLRTLPKACPPLPPPCPKPKPCPKLPTLVNLDELHLQVSAMGAFGLRSDRDNMAGGPAIQATATYRRFIFGGHFLAYPLGEEQVMTGSPPSEVTAAFRWLLGQVEVGYTFPFRNWYAYATVGLGASADRLSYEDPSTTTTEEKKPKTVKEETSFAWSVGGGISAMINKWVSLGAMGRFGLIHGEHIEPKNTLVEGTIVHGSICGTVTFHL